VPEASGGPAARVTRRPGSRRTTARASAGESWDQVRELVAARWEAADPLLPSLPATPGCGASLVVAGPGGQPAAVGTCRHWKGRPGSLDLTWGPSRRFRLAAAVAGPDVAGALDRLLSLWCDHLAGMPGAGSDDTAAIVDWPSRDIGGVASLRRHGLVPLTVVAVRPAGRRGVRPADGSARPGLPSGVPARAGTVDSGQAADMPPGIRIRRAGPDDLAVVARLGMEVVRFDAHFGCVIERPGTAGALQRAASRLLAAPEPWIWLAERDGTPVGLAQAERPESAGWIAPMVRLAPAAYLGHMFVVPGERGRGVASALARRLHREIDAAGAAATLLHYDQVNPVSGPFWSRQGYRPLWTTWEARPARALC
jgi:GNAT superfamily N-acetyltransferase